MIRTLVVDLDDTLIASAQARRRGRQTLAAFNIDPRRFAAAERRWWREYEEHRSSQTEMRLGRFLDFGLSPTEATAADAAYRAVASCVNLRRGAHRFLRLARQRGLRTVILTNGSADPQRGKIEAAGLAKLVDGILVSEEVGFHKPHLEPFRRALGLVNGNRESAAMVGDTLYADVAGALAAGFARVFWVTSRPTEHHDPRVFSVRGLAGVLPLCE